MSWNWNNFNLLVLALQAILWTIMIITWYIQQALSAVNS